MFHFVLLSSTSGRPNAASRHHTINSIFYLWMCFVVYRRTLNMCVVSLSLHRSSRCIFSRRCVMRLRALTCIYIRFTPFTLSSIPSLRLARARTRPLAQLCVRVCFAFPFSCFVCLPFLLVVVVSFHCCCCSLLLSISLIVILIRNDLMSLSSPVQKSCHLFNSFGVPCHVHVHMCVCLSRFLLLLGSSSLAPATKFTCYFGSDFETDVL